jgi:glutamate synthase domain-containing protein 1/glutamate synthase domain-containing protein 3
MSAKGERSRATAILAARRERWWPNAASLQPARTLEGGCGVIGIIGTRKLGGELIRRSCAQMRNRGNGKGGGIAAVGLFDQHADHYALQIGYLDLSVRAAVERELLEPLLRIDHAEQQAQLDDPRAANLMVTPPTVWRYFVRVRSERVEQFAAEAGLNDLTAAEDELLFQQSRALNQRFYVDSDEPQAFVLSQGKNLMILKGVGYAEEIAHYYRLEETRAHLWIGHQRYPTRGRVWHPGGAHPFTGLREALVHNGDFANYHAVSEYLHQWGLSPQFVTDTEVAVQLFDLYTRVLGYPLEYAIEALAPTPEGDFQRLPKRRQRIYRALQSAHLHGSPDGPWFFIIARLDPVTAAPQLIGIADVSMLRPQVFSLQVGEESFGAVASERQAIDAFFQELAATDPSIPALADRYWMTRGGSCADGGAFSYTLRSENGRSRIEVQDKFGARVTVESGPQQRAAERGATPRNTRPLTPAEATAISAATGNGNSSDSDTAPTDPPAPSTAARAVASSAVQAPSATPPRPIPFSADAQALQTVLRRGSAEEFASAVDALREHESLPRVLARLTELRDRRWDPAPAKRSTLIARIDTQIDALFDTLPTPATAASPRLPAADGMLRIDAASAWCAPLPPPRRLGDLLLIDAADFPPEGPGSASRAIVAGHRQGYRNFILYRCRGDRFIGCGLGANSADTRIDVYGSSGDYLGSGLDGAQITVHGDAQDQVGQILKRGRLVIYGDVGQTFLYGAKGGEAFVMGSAGGRALINAVGRIRAIINGTCLDYCAESFMAGEQTGGGFIIINGLTFDASGRVVGLERKYPGNNLFSLASGGACYLNDPYNTATEEQLNGAEFVPFRREDWSAIIDHLRLNERFFGISLRHDLLLVDGVLKWPKEVFRKIVASRETHGLDWSSLQ